MGLGVEGVRRALFETIRDKWENKLGNGVSIHITAE